ncbi:MAG: hypothetical protein ACLQMU_07490 [Methanoregula sp.]|uniref:hypothetical protein n=1 Tax=Methanoregula sp. TaxID=2052170 RepID=UPI003C5A0601
MDIRWQDEEKLLSNWIYKPEKEKWERNNNVTLGFLHWDVYLSEYAKLRRKEIRRGNSRDIAEARMKKLHPVVWSLTMDWYNRQ